MTVVLGGAYQGKNAYIRDELKVTRDDTCFCTGRGIDAGKKAVVGLHVFSYACVMAGIEPIDELRRLCGSLEGRIYAADEISCGVVPMDARMREWREAHGRMMNALAKEADSVVRLFCGIPQVIK